MSQSHNAAPRRSAGTASIVTRRPQSAALRSAGFTATPTARRAGVAMAAGLVALGVAVPAQAAGIDPTLENTATPSSSTTVNQSVSQAAAPAASSQDEQVATPTSSKKGTRYTKAALNVRTSATTKSSRVATLPKGTKVTTTGTTKGSWVQISYKGKKRWVAGQYLTTKTTAKKSTSKASTSSAKQGTRYTKAALNVRSSATTKSSRVATLPKGTKVTTTGTTKGSWVQISYKGKKRWVSGQYLTSSAPAKKSTATKSTKTSAKKSTAKKSSSSISAKRQTVVNAAKRGVGTGYVYGGTAFGRWDCSGFTKWVYSQAGINLPRVSRAQAASLPRTSSPKPGDLVLQNNGGHVGVYIGNGQMISALNSRSGTKQHPVSWMKVDSYHSIG